MLCQSMEIWQLAQQDNQPKEPQQDNQPQEPEEPQEPENHENHGEPKEPRLTLYSFLLFYNRTIQQKGNGLSSMLGSIIPLNVI